MPASKQALPELKPYWTSECGRAVVYVGDCRKVLAQLEPNQFHAVVTDPPYGLEFMGKEWDAPWKGDGGTNARQHRAAEMSDPVKAKYLRHNVTYGGVGKRNNGRIEVADEGTDVSHPFRDGTNRVVYGLSDPQGFQAWFHTCADAMLRVAKPGAHLLSFGGTRMQHRMVCAIEDSGWEVRDIIMWCYGSGFPKSHDISKAIDKMAGADRNRYPGGLSTRQGDGSIIGLGHSGSLIDNDPVTDAAKQWSGWGSALKPAVEPICVARKPLTGTLAQNTLEHGCGGLNIDGCRVGSSDGNTTARVPSLVGNTAAPFGKGVAMGGNGFVLGRWPANFIMSHHAECKLVGTRASKDTSVITESTGEVVSDNTSLSGPNYGRTITGSVQRPDEEVWECHPDCPCRLLDEQSGVSKSSAGPVNKYYTPSGSGCYNLNREAGDRKSDETYLGFGDAGGASRFFYTAKANSDDRPHGKGSTTHPTVKPLDLMRYLVRLVCAQGGIVLDPFMGSGSTGCAALLEGMKFVGVEQSQEYADIAVGRLKLALQSAPELVGEPGATKRVVGVDKPPQPKTEW